MDELTDYDFIWNRACSVDPVRDCPGDRALTDLLRAHGCAMNGGVLHTVECLSHEEISNAESGYRFYGLHPIAHLLSRAEMIFEANQNLEEHESQLDREYVKIIPDDSYLYQCFLKHIEANPLDYAPLRERDKETENLG